MAGDPVTRVVGGAGAAQKAFRHWRAIYTCKRKKEMIETKYKKTLTLLLTIITGLEDAEVNRCVAETPSETRGT